MKTLLIHALTFARLEDRLGRHRDLIDPVTLCEDGLFRAPWSGAADTPIEAPQPDIAYINTDLWWNAKAGRFVKALLETARLEWVQSSAAGVENPTLASIGRKAERYTTCHVQAEAMAEWALWAALDHLRLGPTHRAQKARAEWTRHTSREMMGSRWLIVGFGAIGSATARRVRALGGHVTGVRRSGGTSPHADRIVSAVTPDALAAADVVLVCAPHTPETEGMADAAFFAAMQPDALFLNLGRGALVKEDDLIAALDAGRPGYATLDVTSVEPLPPESPLWRHDRVMITPHDSAITDATQARMDEVFLANLDRYLAGEPLKHLAARSTFEGD
ncbi:MAG: NAD(P)-dependent oxidoreductase [Hyphomonadaceae bacterium]